mgnify:CR=1 FL=1
MQLKDINELLECFITDGFSIDNLCQMTGVSSELIRRFINHDNITHEETIVLGKVVSFLGLLYMVDVEDNSYLKESVSALMQFFHIPNNAISNYLGISSTEFECFLENPKEHPDGYKILIKLMHLKTVLLQGIE